MGDSYDDGFSELAEALSSLYKAELICNKGPWQSDDDVEVVTFACGPDQPAWGRVLAQPGRHLERRSGFLGPCGKVDAMGFERPAVMRFDLPFQADAPSLLSDAIGITGLMERRAASHGIDVTVLDSADDRLLRAGVVLAHRVLGGLGDWYLAAPAWAPHLPAERIVPMGATAELPQEFADLTRPLVRRAVLGPVAALECQRVEYLLRGPDGPLGSIRDERVTVRRGGMATARYREATLTPTDLLGRRQLEHVLAALEAVSANAVDEFPSLQQRLGPPATGGTDFPTPGPLNRGATMEAFVTRLFAADLQGLVRAQYRDEEAITDALQEFRGHVRGLANVLDPEWRQAVESAVEKAATPRQAALDVTDPLVTAVRAPRLGDVSAEPAATLLLNRAQQGAYILADRCRSLTADSPGSDWRAALAAAEQVHACGLVAVRLHGKPGTKLLNTITQVVRDLRDCVADVDPPDLEGLTPAEAFERGREAERGHQRVLAARAGFVADWPERVVKVRKLLAKVRR